MQTNKKASCNTTHEGGKASLITAEQQLHRAVMACMLWENTFYEDGVSIAERITSLVAQVSPEFAANTAIMARDAMKLRHVPLLIVRVMAKLPEHKKLVASTLFSIIQRPDELTEFLSLYWAGTKQPLSAQVKKGLAQAFTKFNAYQLAKYNRDNPIKLRDVLFLSHAKPKDKDQELLWKQLIDGTLPPPDTWEVALSAGKDKKETWERLLKENALGGLALLRNLRNMESVGVKKELVASSLKSIRVERILPFRFISAAKQAPQWEPELEVAMMKCLEGREKLEGHTILLVDVSGSMESKVSGKSDISRLDAACGLSILIQKLCATSEIYSFSSSTVRVPSRSGFALSDAIKNSQEHSSTELGHAVSIANTREYDRLIVITDEQSHDSVAPPKGKGYLINVATYKNGVGYGKWSHIDGWSESVFDYILAVENLT